MTRDKCKVYSIAGVMILAESAPEAKRIYVESYGPHFGSVLRITDGFTLAYQGEKPRKVSERYFIDHVHTFGGGIVHDDP